MDKTIKKRSIMQPTNFAKNLRYLRKAKGFTQAQLAEIVNLKRNQIAIYEGEIAEPSVFSLKAFSKFFHLGIHELLMHDLTIHAKVLEGAVQPKKSDKSELPRSQFKKFVIEMEEMSKILNGYKAFYESKFDSAIEIQSKELYATFLDLLKMLESLIKSNWELIHAGYDEEE